MRALRGLIVSENAELRSRICELLDQTGLIEPALVLSQFPDRIEGAGQVRLIHPQVAFLAIDRIPTALEFIRELQSAEPNATIIAISRLQDPRALTELMRVGVRDFVAFPINVAKFNDAVRRALDQHSTAVLDRMPEPVIAFWPSRGGSGTSTLACNIAHSLSRERRSEVLFADLDIVAGLSRYLFELNSDYSLAELATLGQPPDEYNWGRCVMTFGNLHVLYGGKQEVRPPFTPLYIRDLFSYVSSRFSSIVVDLPATFEGYALEVLRCARRILLVTTNEIPALGLAREKLEYLTKMELHARTGVLLTVSPGVAAPNLPELQNYLGTSVDAVFDFGESRVRRHLSEGTLVSRGTGLGRQISGFAQKLSRFIAH